MNIDRNLFFLSRASNEDLLVLCDIVTKENDGSLRATETLSSTYPYNMYYPDNINRMLPELIHELRLFGGNSVLNFFRGEGPDYSEILHDVAKKCKVPFNHFTDEDEHVERMLLGKLVKDALNGVPDDELRKIIQELDLPVSSFNRRSAILDLEKLWNSGRLEGFLLMASVTTAVLSRLTGLSINIMVSGMTLAGMTSIMLGPIGLILSSLYCIIDLAGPACRVTIPAVIQIAYIRQKMKYNLNQTHL